MILPCTVRQHIVVHVLQSVPMIANARARKDTTIRCFESSLESTQQTMFITRVAKVYCFCLSYYSHLPKQTMDNEANKDEKRLLMAQNE